MTRTICTLLIPKLPLLRYRGQHRLLEAPPPPPAPPPTAALLNSCGHDSVVFVGKSTRIDKLPVGRKTEAGRLHEGGAGFDGQCGHLLREEGVGEAIQGQGEVEVPELELVVVVDGGDRVVGVYIVGVADKARRRRRGWGGGGPKIVPQQHVGDLHGVRVFL